MFSERALEIYQQDGLIAKVRDPYKFMTEQMTLYNCNECQKIYNGGKNDYEGALRENMEDKNFLCKVCSEKALGYGQEFCS